MSVNLFIFFQHFLIIPDANPVSSAAAAAGPRTVATTAAAAAAAGLARKQQ